MKRFLRVLAAVALLSPLAGCGPKAPHYANCDEARAAGVAPLHQGDDGYSKALDRDGDGVACA